MPHLLPKQANMTAEEVRRLGPRLRGETIRQQPNVLAMALEALKGGIQHPGGDLQPDAIALVKRLPQAVLRQTMKLSPAFRRQAGVEASTVLQDALNQASSRYPRLMSHVRLGEPLTSSNLAEIRLPSAHHRGGIRSTLQFDPSIVRFNPQALRANPLSGARLLRHELAHQAQFLSNPSQFHAAYQRGHYGSPHNPAEILAGLAEGIKRSRKVWPVARQQEHQHALEQWRRFLAESAPTAPRTRVPGVYGHTTR